MLFTHDIKCASQHQYIQSGAKFTGTRSPRPALPSSPIDSELITYAVQDSGPSVDVHTGTESTSDTMDLSWIPADDFCDFDDLIDPRDMEDSAAAVPYNSLVQPALINENEASSLSLDTVSVTRRPKPLPRKYAHG